MRCAAAKASSPWIKRVICSAKMRCASGLVPLAWSAASMALISSTLKKVKNFKNLYTSASATLSQNW